MSSEVFEFMTANQAESFPVKTMARTLAVSRSGFYAWCTAGHASRKCRLPTRS